MLTQAQNKKLLRIQEDAEELIAGNVSANHMMQETVKVATPHFLGMMRGKNPSLDVVQYIATRMLAILLSSIKSNEAIASNMQNFSSKN